MSEPLLIRMNTTSRKPKLDSAPKVGVLMSTYNGAAYIEEQLNSIAHQEGVRIVLMVRDDGSSDGTIDCIEEFSKKCDESVTSVRLIQDKNIGFLRSFESLLLNAADCDYYAFADQDDYWDEHKLAIAISTILQSGELPALYASAVTIGDENLSPISVNEFKGFEYSIPSEIIRHRLAGHTMVWNASLQNEIIKHGPAPVWSHDQHVVLIALLANAQLYLDKASYAIHRRLPSSLTPGGGSLTKRFQHERSLIANNDGSINREALAAYILKEGESNLSKEDTSFLELLVRQRSFVRSLKLLFSPKLHCGLFVGDLEAKMSILIGRF